MVDDTEQRLRELLKVEQREAEASNRVSRTMAQVRAGVGARDTLIFAIVRIWTVIAKLLAPLFATLAVRKAEVDAGRRPGAGRQRNSD